MWTGRARRLGLSDDQADDLSRWALEQPGAFDADDLRCWRIASATWLRLADDQLPAVERVERPVGVFVVPAVAGGGWQLVPVLSWFSPLRRARCVLSLRFGAVGSRTSRDR